MTGGPRWESSRSQPRQDGRKINKQNLLGIDNTRARPGRGPTPPTSGSGKGMCLRDDMGLKDRSDGAEGKGARG